VTRRGAVARDDGFITIWLLGLCVVLLFVGGVSLDLWRAFSERRALAAMADAAALAGASGIDRARLHAASEIVLNPELAERLALDALSSQSPAALNGPPKVDVTPDRIRVTLTGEVRYTLLRIFLEDEPLLITVDAVAAPRAVR
jgi:Flp pilus assembly protein TadG